ncbi:Mu-like prophage major head subunit gpT family protein [Serratia liquefaciens]|uniref:Mu-like prophage major head subunit gpT family protein n=1 Tax=Serratia liquefaciens TaxID=614 RepID=UPI0021C7296E|nr:Mu-like prophage major head subunit gpT family protein [Serratia liquefaciens]
MSVNIEGVIAEAQVAFNVKFEQGAKAYSPIHPRLANEVPSSSGSNAYGFLEDFPEIEEWLNDRQLKELSTQEYSIKNRTFESSISIKRESFEDNDYGKYSMLFEQYGRKAAEFPDKLMMTAMIKGHNQLGIDGQNFFDTDHTVSAGVYSNLYGTAPEVAPGQVAKPSWYLFDGNQGLKPFIYQNRRPIVVTSVTNPEDAEVFLRNKYLFGVDGRLNVGYGMWQCAAASYDELTAENFATVYDGMLSVKGGSGEPLGITPSIIVVPVSLRVAAEKILLRQQLESGEDNPNYKRVEIIVSPYL